MQQIYLDYNASTPIAREVAEAMQPFLYEHYGNPSSSHWAGAPAKEAFEQARTRVANLLQCNPGEVVFTSGGSESNNYALKGVYEALKAKGNHIITTNIEHPAIMEPCRYLETQGATITYIEVDETGRVCPDEIQRALTDETILISVMHANNEVGTIQPLAEIGEIAKKHGVLFHSDAAQSIGKINTEVDHLQVDLLSIAGHKLYAPKGVGALYIRSGTPVSSFIHGADHEQGRRAGTENILLTVGLGAACKLAKQLIADQGMVLQLRDYFWEELSKHFGDKVTLNGHVTERLPNTLNVSFAETIGQDLLARIPQLAASTGSACHAGVVELSPVLEAMKVDESIGKGTIRFSLGKDTTKAEIDTVLTLLKEHVTD